MLSPKWKCSAKAAGVHSRTKVCDLEPGQVEALFKAFQEAKLPPPPIAPAHKAGAAQGRGRLPECHSAMQHGVDARTVILL